MPRDRGDREYDKFRDGSADNETRIAIKIEESIPLTVTGGGGSSGGISQADKTAFVEGTTEFNPIGGVFNETAAGDPAEDEAAAARITAKRALHANLRNNSGTEVGTSGTPLRMDPTGSTAQPVTDNGGSLTVDGTVASTQSGTWILGANSGVDIGDVTINNAAGAAAVNIQDGGNSITVDGTVAATQSGTWILGANSGVDIGDVTINNASGASAVNIQDGGNSITIDGSLTNISGTISLPTGASTLSEQQTQTTSLQLIDDIAHAANAALSKGVPIMGQLDDTGTATVTENNVGIARITAGRAVHTAMFNSAGTQNIGDSINTNISSIAGAIYSVEGPEFSAFLGSGGSAQIDISTNGFGDAEAHQLRVTRRGALWATLADSTGAVVSLATSTNQSTMITSLQLIDDLPLAQASTTSGQKGILTQGAVTTAAPSYTTAQTSPLSLTTTGDLRIAAASLPLPSGAATSANQTTEITSLQIIDDLPLAQASTTSGQTGPLVQGATTTAAPSYTTAKTNPLSLTTAGALRIDGSGVTQPISGNVNIGTFKDGGAFAQEADNVAPVGFVLDETAGTALSENDIAAPRIDSKRAIINVIEDETTRGRRATVTAGKNIAVTVRDESANQMPAMDTGARSGFVKIYDGSAVYNTSAIVVSATGVGVLGVLAIDSTLNTARYKSTGEFPTHTGSTDNTLANSKYLKVDSNGNVNIIDTGRTKTTYSACIQGLATAVTATDIFTIKGSATKTVSITQIVLTGVATTAISVPVDLVIRSTADTAGTSTAPALVPHDSNDAAATAVVAAYTVNPTLGTAVGSIRTEKIAFTVTGVVGSRSVYDFGVRPGKPIVLRGTAQQLCVNFNATTVLGSSIDVWVEFTEE